MEEETNAKDPCKRPIIHDSPVGHPVLLTTPPKTKLAFEKFGEAVDSTVTIMATKPVRE